MSNLFNKRMQMLLQNGSVGGKLIADSNIIEDKIFENDRNFHRGMLYDWNMCPLEDVDFKLEKIKTYATGGTEVEYMVRFRPNYNPEYKFKHLRTRKDGKEQFGFYIDVINQSKKTTEKWLITGKDDRVAFDRYNVLKCNWCFEWVNNNEYYNCVGCIRENYRSTADQKDKLGGTTVDGDISILTPTSDIISMLELGTRLMITDSCINPQVYEVVKRVDFSPLGVTTFYLKQVLYNAHVDFCGDVNLQNDYKFCFKTPIKNLPEAYGGQYHMICDCVINKNAAETPIVHSNWELKCGENRLYVHGNAVQIEAVSSNPNVINYTWHIYVDGKEYQVQELTEYFNITIKNNSLVIKAINKIMAKYMMKIEIHSADQVCLDSVVLEVCI